MNNYKAYKNALLALTESRRKISVEEGQLKLIEAVQTAKKPSRRSAANRMTLDLSAPYHEGEDFWYAFDGDNSSLWHTPWDRWAIGEPYFQ